MEQEQNPVRNVFIRHEIKFLVSDRQRTELEQEILKRMDPDAYGESTVCSVYYDTPDNRMIRRSLEKPEYKEKIRVRSYGAAGDGDTVFLEVKKKFRDTVFKRRIFLPCRDAAAFLTGSGQLPESSQIGSEFEYLRRFYPTLTPAMYIRYDRTAFCGRADEPTLRVTFDQNIYWRDDDFHLSASRLGTPVLARGMNLMEIKSPGSIPVWLADFLCEKKIYRTSFSKYGSAYLARMGKTKVENKSEMRDDHCA